jgi:hypothetical protein
MSDTNLIIKQINTGTSTYDIAARYLTDESGNYITYASMYNDLVDIAHGVIDTYVIPTSKQGINGGIVGSEKHTTDEILVATLASLVVPENQSGTFKVGDIILMEAQSTDGKKAFDRWVSWVSSDGKKVKLTVLESQVAKHYHELTLTPQTSEAYVSIKTSTYTTTLATVDTATSVVYGASGSVMTGVSYADSGNATTSLTITNTSGNTSVSHSHTIDSHGHTFNPSTLVSDTANVYTNLSTDTYTPHTHKSVDVASVQTDDTESIFTYATGAITDIEDDTEFLISVKGSDSYTLASSPETGNNNGGTETYGVKTGVTVTSSVNTTSSGTHTHTATVATGNNVVTSVTYAPKVVTSISYTSGNVQTEVVTGVTTSNVTVVTSWGAAPTSSFVSSWSCSVSNGVLSFTALSGNAVTSATKVSGSDRVKVVNTISSASQSNATCSVSDTTQSASKSSVTLTVTVSEAGAHEHGFSHTHTLPTHTHTVNSHTHGYVKTIASQKAKAITSFSLVTSSYTPHKHTPVSVADVESNVSAFTYVITTSSTSNVDVVKSLKTSATVNNSSLTMSSEYIGIAGSIRMPDLVPAKSALSTLLSTKQIIPAKTATSDEQAIRSIEFNKGDFVTSVTGYTKTNVGGTHS